MVEDKARVGKLRFWCQKILPLVYEDSLSYYEVLDKTVEKLNEVIDYTNDNIRDVIEEVVHDYYVSITYNETLQQINLSINH